MLKHDLIPYWYELYKLNKKLGHRNDIFRNVEDSFVLKYGNFSKKDIVLDIGSGESTVPVFIRKRYGSSVHATDLDIGVLDIQKKYCSILNCSLKIEAQDATKLTYPAEHFDKVIAISSIEHIPENGDTFSVKEFMRVLKPGGKCLITVPFGIYEEKKQTWYYSGFERRYDLDNLRKRLLSVSDLEVEELLFLSTPNAGFVHEIAELVGNIFEVYYKWIELTEEPRSSFGALISMIKK
jgi:SAM-dependent methyltransferase